MQKRQAASLLALGLQAADTVAGHEAELELAARIPIGGGYNGTAGTIQISGNVMLSILRAGWPEGRWEKPKPEERPVGFAACDALIVDVPRGGHVRTLAQARPGQASLVALKGTNYFVQGLYVPASDRAVIKARGGFESVEVWRNGGGAVELRFLVAT